MYRKGWTYVPSSFICSQWAIWQQQLTMESGKPPITIIALDIYTCPVVWEGDYLFKIMSNIYNAINGENMWKTNNSLYLSVINTPRDIQLACFVGMYSWGAAHTSITKWEHLSRSPSDTSPTQLLLPSMMIPDTGRRKMYVPSNTAQSLKANKNKFHCN